MKKMINRLICFLRGQKRAAPTTAQASDLDYLTLTQKQNALALLGYTYLPFLLILLAKIFLKRTPFAVLNSPIITPPFLGEKPGIVPLPTAEQKNPAVGIPGFTPLAKRTWGEELWRCISMGFFKTALQR